MLCFPLLFAADVIRWANYTTQPIAGILESWCHTSHQLTPTLTCWITKNLTPMRPTSAEQTRLFRVPRLLLVSWTGLGLGDRPWSRGPALVLWTGLGLVDRPWSRGPALVSRTRLGLGDRPWSRGPARCSAKHGASWAPSRGCWASRKADSWRNWPVTGPLGGKRARAEGEPCIRGIVVGGGKARGV